MVPFLLSPQWRSQVIAIGWAPTVRMPISVALVRALHEIERDEHSAWARARPGPPFATPLCLLRRKLAKD